MIISVTHCLPDVDSGTSRARRWSRSVSASATAWASSWLGMKSSYSLWVFIRYWNGFVKKTATTSSKDGCFPHCTIITIMMTITITIIIIITPQVSLLQQVKMVPPLHHDYPSPENYISNLTRIPDDFYLRIIRVWIGNYWRKKELTNNISFSFRKIVIKSF